VVVDRGNDRVRKVSNGQAFTVPYTGLTGPGALALDRQGNYIVGDDHQLLRITPAGVATTLANGFLEPHAVALAPSGHFYVADVFECWRVAPTGTKTRVAGVLYNGLESAADVPIGDVRFSDIRGIAVDAAGEVFVTESVRNKLWRLWLNPS
jgi:sugar lactone lactonase YvrE